MTLAAASQALLARHSGQEDVAIGVPRAGRSAKFAGTVGYFVNAAVLRCDLGGDRARTAGARALPDRARFAIACKPIRCDRQVRNRRDREC